MNANYSYRICAALPGDEPVELFRTRSAFDWKTLHSWTDELSSIWEWWVEYPTPARELVGKRVVYYRPTNAAYSAGIKLKIKAAP